MVLKAGFIPASIWFIPTHSVGIGH